MKLSIATLFVASYVLQLGNASEISNRALKSTRGVKDDLKRLNTFLKFYAFIYSAELNEDLDNAENQYKEKFNQEIHSVLDKIKHGTKLYKHVEKLEKEVGKSNEIDLKSLEEKRLPAVKASVKFYDFAINNVMKRVEKVTDASKKQAEECNKKELTDVDAIALNVQENAFNCTNQA